MTLRDFWWSAASAGDISRTIRLLRRLHDLRKKRGDVEGAKDILKRIERLQRMLAERN